MATRQPRQLRVAAVQLDCQVGQVQQNLDHATRFVEGAAQRGAHLVLLPELMPGGYQLTEEIWNCAELLNGPTVTWLTSLAKQLGIYLGTSLLEVEEEDFYNTFVLATPAGEIAGRVRKSPPASLEAYFYRSGNGGHVIDTAIGRIGAGICYENLLYERLTELYEAAVDLVLQPAAAGRPRPFIPGDVKRFDDMMRRSAPHYAHVLGVPVTLRTVYTPSGGPRGRPAASWSSLSPSAVLWLQRTCPARFRILIAALWSLSRDRPQMQTNHLSEKVRCSKTSHN